MKVYDFKCSSCGIAHEHFVANSDVHTVECRECGHTAERQLCSPRFALDPNDAAGFPTAYQKWGDQQAAKAKKDTSGEQ